MPAPPHRQGPFPIVAQTTASIERLQASGYLQCVEQHDELHDDCPRRRPARDWLRFTWSATESNGGASAGSAGHGYGGPLSWWLDGTPSKSLDGFDGEAFVANLESIAAEDVAAVANRVARKRAERMVMFVGDSTARQQAVSLCCLLKAARIA